MLELYWFYDARSRGFELVQLYFEDPVAEVAGPVMQLLGCATLICR
jgi:hypothetical protein